MNDVRISNESSIAPCGIRRAGPDGQPIIDALAGRASVFGFGYSPLIDTIQAAANGYLGDATADIETTLADIDSATDPLRNAFCELASDEFAVSVGSLCLASSTDMAMEMALQLARTRYPSNRYRTLALVGSDHGRTMACRTASGRPELHDGLGPMVAGFAHLPINDAKALRASVDDQTACLLLSPIDFSNGAKPIDADYLVAAREVCDEREILLMIDESQICFGASGELLTFSSIAKIHADAVILSAGLFGGMAGGLLVASESTMGGTVANTRSHPMQRAILLATLKAMKSESLFESLSDVATQFAVSLAEKIGGFEFVRDVNATGMTIGIETDVPPAELIATAAKRKLRVDDAGDTGIRIQLPLVFSSDDSEELLNRLEESFEAIERQTADLNA